MKLKSAGEEKSAVYHERVEVDEDQAGRHDQVRNQREGSQVLQVGGEDQQDEGRQEAEHVETGVEARHQHLCLVGVVHVAVEGGGVSCFYHLMMAEVEEKLEMRRENLCLDVIFHDFQCTLPGVAWDSLVKGTAISDRDHHLVLRNGTTQTKSVRSHGI